MSAPPGRDPAEALRLLQLLRRSGSEVECVVTGGSMGDAIPDGSMVRVRLDGAAGAKDGSAVALLLAGDTFSIHRLIRRGRSTAARDWLVTQGDGNIFPDAPQRVADVLGVVTAVQRPGADWSPVPAPARHGILRRAITGGFERCMSAALELHPRLGAAVKAALVIVMTPVAWLQPYESGRGRSTSRLLPRRGAAAP